MLKVLHDLQTGKGLQIYCPGATQMLCWFLKMPRSEFKDRSKTEKIFSHFIHPRGNAQSTLIIISCSLDHWNYLCFCSSPALFFKYVFSFLSYLLYVNIYISCLRKPKSVPEKLLQECNDLFKLGMLKCPENVTTDMLYKSSDKQNLLCQLWHCVNEPCHSTVLIHG